MHNYGVKTVRACNAEEIEIKKPFTNLFKKNTKDKLLMRLSDTISMLTASFSLEILKIIDSKLKLSRKTLRRSILESKCILDQWVS
jgi:hypothetical protein